MTLVLLGALAFAAGAAHRAPVSPVAPGFKIRPTTASLQGMCHPEATARRLIRLLDAFNSGRAREFSRRFTADATLHPYSGGPDDFQRRGRSALERFVWRRHRSGDTWAATALHPPPTHNGQHVAVYGLGIRVQRFGRPTYEAGAKVIVVCSTGRVLRWVGPLWKS